MAGRGRGRGGRGWGRGGGFTTFASQVPFDLFPEDVSLPEFKIDDIDHMDENTKKLLQWSNKLQNYWKASPYLLEETTSKKRQTMHVERFSDKKTNDFTRDSLSQVLMFNGFPHELVLGKSKHMSRRKKFRWKPESDMKNVDIFEQEKANQEKEETDEAEKKEGEDEDGDGNAEEEDEEDMSDDDYNQNIDFDDDDDDFNDVDDGDDEPIY
ncbi:DNA-directed RNA polymerase III subunit RPC7 [Vigna radiata var. radiata]|uniref:DNA-directed RNA polymerase III subunit RPC7 n=1 Tax=Vigna radiata var. radiata TaxID=3916 RepID=A0A1S3VHS7_VIGRR|nr:DNA-directed RNA polymerase III subunit RPC7 [Vigna radiata var. radiata]